VFILPAVIVSVRSIPVTIGRTIAVSSFFFFLPIAILVYGLNPKTRMILPAGKFSEPRYDKARQKIELAIRLCVVLFGIFVLVTDTLPFTTDLIHRATGEKPTEFTATVTDTSAGLGAVLVGKRSVRFSPRDDSYYLLYCWSQLKIGHTYEFSVLPRSRMILDFRAAATNK